jgi:hypothetical protein
MIQRVRRGAATHPRRAAILLTDGVDNASRLTARTARIAEGPTPNLRAGSRAAATSGAAGPHSRRSWCLSPTRLGAAQRIPKTEQMPAVVRELFDELASRFIITYATSGVGVDKYRTLEVTVDG